jgi:hypothetical protein
VSFGSGIRRSLNEDYRQAQKRDGVITSLEPRSLEDARQAIHTSNRKVLEAFRKDLAASSLSFKRMAEKKLCARRSLLSLRRFTLNESLFSSGQRGEHTGFFTVVHSIPPHDFIERAGTA